MGSIFPTSRKIVNQAVDTRLLDVLPILTGIVQTLPTSFEKLVITVHPETFERIQEEKENTKEYWLLQLVEWKYDFSLQFGEFVLEEEKEFFEFKFAPIFAKLRQKWKKRSYLRSKCMNRLLMNENQNGIHLLKHRFIRKSVKFIVCKSSFS